MSDKKYAYLTPDDDQRETKMQNYFLVSFVDPPLEVKEERELYFVSEFVNSYLPSFLFGLSVKYNIPEEELKIDFDKLKDSYKTFRMEKHEELSDAFSAKQEYRTTMRGFKVRGVFPTVEQANQFVKKLRIDDQDFDIYVASMKQWVPFNLASFGNVTEEFVDEELNTLISTQKKQRELARAHHKERISEMKQWEADERKRREQEERERTEQSQDEDDEKTPIIEEITPENTRINPFGTENTSTTAENTRIFNNQDPWMSRKQQENIYIPHPLETAEVEADSEDDEKVPLSSVQEEAPRSRANEWISAPVSKHKRNNKKKNKKKKK